MNPFTRSLLRRLNDRQLGEFVAAWDQLEALIIQIYKSGEASPTDEAALKQTRRRLSRHYPRWQPDLSRYWPQMRAGGEPLDGDPFEMLLSIQTGDGIPGNWRAMQILPAAREALNQYLLDRIDK